jgi:uncharacterized membrane protein YccC
MVKPEFELFADDLAGECCGDRTAACGRALSGARRKLPPQLMAAAIAQLLDEQRAALAELQDGPRGWPPMHDLLSQVVQERIAWLEEELAMRLPPEPG